MLRRRQRTFESYGKMSKERTVILAITTKLRWYPSRHHSSVPRKQPWVREPGTDEHLPLKHGTDSTVISLPARRPS